MDIYSDIRDSHNLRVRDPAFRHGLHSSQHGHKGPSLTLIKYTGDRDIGYHPGRTGALVPSMRTLGTTIIYEQVPGPMSKYLKTKYSGDGDIWYPPSGTGALVPLLHMSEGSCIAA